MSNYKLNKYKNKINKYRSSSGGAKSLNDTVSTSYTTLLAAPPKKLGIPPIPIISTLVEKNFPPSDLRQWALITNTITGYFTELFHRYHDPETDYLPPLFVLLGFKVNFSAETGDNYGVTPDKHALVFSLLRQQDGYYLEIFNANGIRNASNHLRIKRDSQSRAYRDINQLVTNLCKSIAQTDWFSTITNGSTIKKEVFPNGNINTLTQGHCDLFSISYIEGRFRYPEDNRMLLENLEMFDQLDGNTKEKIVARRNKELQQKIIPGPEEFSLTPK
jgi:hypothetical protein